MNLDAEIAEVEAFMGRPFKKRPRVQEWNHTSIQEFLTEEAKLLGDPKPTLIEAIMKARDGYSAYNFRTRTILTNGQRINNLHELGHAYADDQWPEAFMLPKKLQQKRKYTEEEWHALYAHRALHEGIANYCALTIQYDFRSAIILSQKMPRLNAEALQELNKKICCQRAFFSNINAAYGLGFALVKTYCKKRDPHEAIGELIALKPDIIEMGTIIERSR